MLIKEGNMIPRLYLRWMERMVDCYGGRTDDGGP